MSSQDMLDSLNQAAAGIAIWDDRQHLTSANKPFFYAYNLAPPEGELPSFSKFLEIVARSGELVLSSPLEAWVEEQIRDFGQEKAVEQQMADGRTLRIVQRRSGTRGMIVTLHDISDLKRVEAELRRARDLAEASDEAKSRFLRAANHDLRQPLATLKILIYNCLTESDESHRKDLLHTMDVSVSIMEDLLGALLQIGQLDAGQIVARVTTFQLSTIFDRLRIQFAHQAKEKGLKLRFVGARYTIKSDKALLERIITNLLANAIRYTDVGGVVVGCRPRGRNLSIEVWDSGRGIAPEHLPRIFDEFYQVSSSRRTQRPGLGLGLNIVRRLSELLGHSIDVSSLPGRGSVFSLTVEPGDVWQSEFDELEVSEMTGGEFAGAVILLIEDDNVLRQTTVELLERWGIVVMAATSGQEARQLLGETALKPQLIIADYSLRGEFGTEVVHDLRREIGAEVPALIVTADVDPDIIDRIRRGDIPFLIKPVSPPRLRVMMHNLLFETPSAPGALEMRGQRYPDESH